jgi:multicomponent Na+:H+ antiporter subunit B
MLAENIIRRVVARVMVPFIQLFGLYVIMHGDSSPGGGFQGGVILGASIILYAIIFGRRAARKRFAQAAGDIYTSSGLLIYALVGLACIFFGGNYLEYDVLPIGEPHFASHIGILAIEIGVGMTVAAVMSTIYFEMSRRREPRRGEEGG